MGYSPCFFPKTGSKNASDFYYNFCYILMFLCYIESLSQFWLRVFELCHLKVPCAIVYAFLKTDLQSRPIFITFYVLIIYI